MLVYHQASVSDNAAYRDHAEAAHLLNAVAYKPRKQEQRTALFPSGMADILDEISTSEHSQGRPLLSVVVVQAETGRPWARLL
jgi:hypothetical protein